MRSTSMEQRTVIERLARHLAGAQSDDWPARVEDAASILAILKEPDAAMREAGDPNAWAAMIDAALRARYAMAQPSAAAEPSPGSDEEGEIRLSPAAIGSDHADWVHVPTVQEDKR